MLTWINTNKHSDSKQATMCNMKHEVCIYLVLVLFKSVLNYI